MQILITGICGFVGQTLARSLQEQITGLKIIGVDNLIRAGSESNRAGLAKSGIEFHHGDIRSPSDLEVLPPVDWVIDAAANASVLAGVDGQMASRQLVEHNLGGTFNLLEYCKRHQAGFILLSTSRVYSIQPLATLRMEVVDRAFRPQEKQAWPTGCSPRGVAESFSTSSPISLYGSTKLASEILAREYGATFKLPVWINRCGVLAGAGQFGRIDQGVFSFWIHSFAQGHPLRYIGFGGSGCQVRDCLHPRDLTPLLVNQMAQPTPGPEEPINLGGGLENSISLGQLSDWCSARFVPRKIDVDATPRRFDIPWLVMDCQAAAQRWGWQPRTKLPEILEEIATHAEKNPHWIEHAPA